MNRSNFDFDDKAPIYSQRTSRPEEDSLKATPSLEQIRKKDVTLKQDVIKMVKSGVEENRSSVL